MIVIEYPKRDGNPVSAFREERNLEIPKFAKFVGVSANSIYRVENGYPATLPNKIQRSLNGIEDELGNDLAAEYSEWWQQEREKILSSQEA